MSEIKYCIRCKQSKPLDWFYNHKSSKDGRQLYCKQCMDFCNKDVKGRRQLPDFIPKKTGTQKLTVKICPWCKVLKDRSEFGESKGKINYYCVDCRKLANLEYKLKNKESAKDCYLRRVYNISLMQYNEILANQSFTCAICKTNKLNAKLGAVFAVDHDHGCCPGKKSCGKCIRGLLCDICNRGLGYFRDDINILTQAIEYLEKDKYYV